MCDYNIHLALLEVERRYCPFCDKTIKENEIVEEKCCENQNVKLRDGSFVCINWGLVHGYTLEYCKFIDFYNNMYKFRKNQSISENTT